MTSLQICNGVNLANTRIARDFKMLIWFLSTADQGVISCFAVS